MNINIISFYILMEIERLSPTSYLNKNIFENVSSVKKKG